MKNKLKEFRENFELYLGSFFLAITSIIVIINVFTRYFLRFTFSWSEEIAVGAFVWTIFLGFANAFKTKSIIGVELIVNLFPEKGKRIVEFITSIILVVLSSLMFYFSYIYVSKSTKITSALEISYRYIYASLIISFALITLYSIYFAVQNFKKMISKKNIN